MWRDPLDELIEDLERVVPAPATAVINDMPSCDDFQFVVCATLYASDEERKRIEAGPHYRRVQQWLEKRAAQRAQESSMLAPQSSTIGVSQSKPGCLCCAEGDAEPSLPSRP
jgi:hypothetical protein